MATRSIDWPWALTNLCLALFLAHFLLIMGAGLLLPVDWLHAATVTSIGAAFLAIVSFLAVIWLDYRSRAGWRPLRDVFLVGLLVIGTAEVLETTYRFDWWLTAGATAAMVAPLWWWRHRRRSNDCRR
jgi:hypothetical protein